jgi:hypothetical protein
MAENSYIPSHCGTTRATRKSATGNAVPWSSLASRPMTAEDEREIAENITGFFSIVAQWEARERCRPIGVEQFRGGGARRLTGAA